MHGKPHRHISIIVAALVLFLVLLSSTLQAAPERSVTLTYFIGESVETGARLEWQTATELDTAGFWLKRASTSSGPFVALDDIGMVPAQGSATSGSTYETVDETAETGRAYWYQLVEVEYNGAESALQTIRLQIGATPTATVEGIATSEEGSTTEAPAETASPAPQTSPTSSGQAATNTPRATSTLEAAGSSATTTPLSGEASATVVRSVGSGGIAEAAEPTRDEPLILAQATEAYPGVTTTETVPDDDGYPEPSQIDTPTLAISTVENYPSGAPPAEASDVVPGDRFDNAVGGSGDNAPSENVQSGESSTLSRVLLWIGFIAALLIFVAGAALSIILSTRKQRSNL